MTPSTLRLSVLALTLVLSQPVAGAQVAWEAPSAPSADDVDAGRDAYLRGLALLEDGEPDAALAEFRLSYSLSGAGAALFNGAFALARLARWTEARVALRLLEDREVNDEVRASAASLAREVEASLAYLRLEDVPDDARVVVDGRPVEATGAIPLDPGEHAIAVRRPPAPPFEWRGSLLAGERRTLAVTFATAVGPGSVTLDEPSDDGPIIAGVITAILIAALAGGGIALGFHLDGEAQLMGDAPHVIELP